MRWVLFAVLVVHALVHALGFAKGLGLAALPQLARPISRRMGVAWLVAGVLVLAAAVALVAAPAHAWPVALAAAVASQAVVATSFRDARFGTIPNVILLGAAVLGFQRHGPFGMRAEYDAGARAVLDASRPEERPLGEADLARLPAPVQRHVRRSGALGRPPVSALRARWRGRIRGGPADAWMTFEADQASGYRGAHARLFFMDATMKGVPVDVFHRFVGDDATFRVKVLSTITMVDASGPEMNHAETVTVFNDLCILAPSRLAERPEGRECGAAPCPPAAIAWEPIDDRRARARYTRGKETITAELAFDEAGDLVDFVTDDRSQSSPDGRTFVRKRWSTPLSAYRDFGGVRLPSRGEARWHDGDTSWAYLEIELVDVAYDPGLPARADAPRVALAVPAR